MHVHFLSCLSFPGKGGYAHFAGGAFEKHDMCQKGHKRFPKVRKPAYITPFHNTISFITEDVMVSRSIRDLGERTSLKAGTELWMLDTYDFYG